MALNKYYNNFNYGREQDLIEDLIIESIKMYGYDCRYLPRTFVRKDPLFGEDTLSKFEDAVELEMYIKNVEGFEGEGDFLSRFGLQIRDQITFTVARKRFDQARSESLMTEVGYQILQEEADTNAPSRLRLSQSANTEMFSIQLETATAEGYAIETNRPTEGDLIYFPLTEKMYEIKFVEHEAIFYQMGRLQTYDIVCELWEYSSEQVNTGNTQIDGIEDRYTMDILQYEFLLEDDTKLLSEDGGSVIQEFRIETNDPSANNEFFDNKDPMWSGDEIIDFSELNPFSDYDRY